MCISDLIMSQYTQKYKSKSIASCHHALPIEKYLIHKLEGADPKGDQFRMHVDMQLYSTFFNPSSQSFEPLLEPWKLRLRQVLPDQDNVTNTFVSSDDMMNINFTESMA